MLTAAEKEAIIKMAPGARRRAEIEAVRYAPRTVRYFASHKVTKGKLSSGFETKEEARAQAEFLATTYGGVSKVSANTADIAVEKFSAKRGWH